MMPVAPENTLRDGPGKTPAVDVSFQSLLESFSNLHESIMRLKGRLHPVLTDVPEGVSNAKTPTPEPRKLIEKFNMLRTGVRGTNEIVQDLLSRLEL
jgi:hypothetical protein